MTRLSVLREATEVVCDYCGSDQMGIPNNSGSVIYDIEPARYGRKGWRHRLLPVRGNKTASVTWRRCDAGRIWSFIERKGA